MSPVILQILTLTGLILVGAGCQESPTTHHSKRKLVITGSSTVAPLMAEIGKRFEILQSGVRIDVQTGGSSRGIADARQGLADIGMTSRALTSDETDLHGTAIARDGIGVIIHTSNVVSALDDGQIADIYTGRITNWNAVGGADALIVVVNKAEGRATLELFLKYLNLINTEIQAHVIIGDNEQGIKTVAGNPNAIAYVSIGTAEYDARREAPIKLLPLGNVPATLETLRTGTFPLTRPLTLVTKAPPSGLIKTFIDFARSPDVHDLVTQHFFVPISS